MFSWEERYLIGKIIQITAEIIDKLVKSGRRGW
jgi:hypothetical protein